MKVAFIGAGYMTTEHLKAFRSLPGVTLVGIFSRTLVRAQQLAAEYGVRSICDSIQELHAQTQADLVIISVPELETRKVCEEVFKYPWKVLVEKPAGFNVGDAESILASSLAQQRDVFVAFNRRHYSSTLGLIEGLKDKKGMRYIHICDQEDQLAARKAGQPELVVKNWMYANSIHLIDYFTFLGRGEIVAVDNVVPWDSEKPAHVLTKITYSSGDVGIYEAVWNRPGPWVATVTVDECRFELRPMETLGVQSYGTRKLEPLPIHSYDQEFKPGLRVQAEEALKAVQGKAHRLPGLEEALHSMKLVQRIYSEVS